MNIIVISPDIFDKYFQYRFVKNQMETYRNWISDYWESGKVAFVDFYLGFKQDDPFLFLSKATFMPADPTFGIGFNTYVERKNGQKVGGHILASVRPMDEGFDVGIDINERDERWKDFGITCLDDFCTEEKNSLVFNAAAYMCLFAKIQSEAMKSQKRIIKMCDSIKTGSKKDDKKQIDYRPIILSHGIQYIYQKGSTSHTDFVRHCEAWSVRGHFRHYKSGKTIYISPYQKGSGRLKDTTYKIKGLGVL